MGILLFIIDGQGGLYFNLFYILAFLFSYVWLVLEGHQRRFNFVSWLLALACSRFLFIVGTKVFTYTSTQWQAFFTSFQLPPTSDKILLGGLLLTLLGYWPLKKLLALRHDAVDAFAIMLPIAIGVQRFGCWLAGCCHGNVTTLPWGMQYTPGTLPHFHQFEAGLLQSGQFYSLPVHPTQLYEVAACVLVVGVLLLARKRLRADGSLFMLALLLYGSCRFFIEFFRDAQAHAAGGEILANLKLVQWYVIGMVVSFGAAIFYREQRFVPDNAKEKHLAPAPPLVVTLVLLMCLTMASWGLRNWFTYAELIALQTSTLPALAMAGLLIFRTISVPQYRWLTASLLVLPLLLMSQTLPGGKTDSVQVKEYHSVKVGLGSGNYINSHNMGYGDGCSRVSNTGYFKQEYTVGGAGYAITKQEGKETFTYGLNGYVGHHTETNVTDPGARRVVNDVVLFGINPHFQYDRRWYGFGVGFHLGNLFYTTEDLQEERAGTPEKASNRLPVYPQLHIRLGPTRYLFTDFRLADQFPSAMPGLRTQLSIGSGFGLRNGSHLRLGTNTADILLAGHFVLGEKLVLEPLYLWDRPNLQFSDKQHQFLLGLHYRIHKK